MLSSKRAPCSVFDSLVLLRINVGKDEAKILVSLCYVFSGGCFFFFFLLFFGGGVVFWFVWFWFLFPTVGYLLIIQSYCVHIFSVLKT